MEKTYDEIINHMAAYIHINTDSDDFDKGELSGAAIAIARIYGKNKMDVKTDIRNTSEMFATLLKPINQ